MDINELAIETLGRWGEDCIECANTLQRYSNIEKNIPTRITICTGEHVDKASLYTRDELMDVLREKTRFICFRDLKQIVVLFNSLSDVNPYTVINAIWRECNNIYPNWSLWFDEYKKQIEVLL